MLEKQVLSKLLSKAFDVPVMVTYWDGKSENYGDGLPKIHIKLNEKPNMKSLAKMPTFTLAEAYMNRGIEIEGSIQELIASAYRQSGSFLTDQSGFKGTLTKMLHGHDKNESKEDIHSHYDIGNDFYKEWLGPSMTYSAAYWPKDGMTLEEAQMAKVHHILDKLHSEPGKKLLDIGSGWGTLIITAAQEYGLETYGVTLSEEQYAFTNQRIQELGLQDKVHVMLRDYRDVDMTFDYITSVGMFEHVGKENLGEYFKDVANYLVPNGRALIHGITGQHYGAGVDPFIQKYIFLVVTFQISPRTSHTLWKPVCSWTISNHCVDTTKRRWKLGLRITTPYTTKQLLSVAKHSPVLGTYTYKVVLLHLNQETLMLSVPND